MVGALASCLRIDYSKKYAAVRGIDNEVCGNDIGGIGHRDPVGSKPEVQIVGLGLQSPAEMILRPGKLHLAVGHLQDDVGRLIRRQRNRIDLR